MSGSYDNFNGHYQENDMYIWTRFYEKGLNFRVEANNGHGENLIRGCKFKTANQVLELLYNLNYIEEHFPKLFTKLNNIYIRNFFETIGFELDKPSQKYWHYWLGNYKLPTGQCLRMRNSGGIIRIDSEYKGLSRTILDNSTVSNVKDLSVMLKKNFILQIDFPNLALAISQAHVGS